jgi:hypothetical protein
MAKQVVRGWSHVERRENRPALGLRGAVKRLLLWRSATQRKQDDLPWPNWGLPLLLFTLIMVTFGVWAAYRVVEAKNKGVDLGYPSYALVLIFILLTLAALAAKVVEHNPWADVATKATRGLAASRRNFDKQVRKAEAAQREHASAWQKARSQVDGAEGSARRVVNQAWVCVLERRADHGLAGHLAPEFGSPEGSGDSTARMFAALPEPAVSTACLAGPRQVLSTCDGGKLFNRQRTLIHQLIEQFAPAERTAEVR